MQKKEKKHHPCKLQSIQSSLNQFKVDKPISVTRLMYCVNSWFAVMGNGI